jgi:hypothetical protein
MIQINRNMEIDQANKVLFNQKEKTSPTKINKVVALIKRVEIL